MSMAMRKRELQPLPVAVMNLDKLVKPKRRKKKVAHTKDPYSKKQEVFVERAPPELILDGFLILNETKSEMPHEVIKLKIVDRNITKVNENNLKYFVNLSYIDVSENRLQLKDFQDLPNLVHLILRANQMETIQLAEDHHLTHLEILDLAYNHIAPQSIINLFPLANLRALELSANNLASLPEDLSLLSNLEELYLSRNNFVSDRSASALWRAFSSLPKLLVLDISYNYLRGIHTEKLIAGNFATLEILDFSYNTVDNQHNLICARNFVNLKQLIVTGNPFANAKEFRGLEMELYSRTGAELVIKDVERPYLKQKKNPRKLLGIKFDKLVKVKEDRFHREKKTHFFGVELPEPAPQDEPPQEPLEEEEEVKDEDEDIDDEVEYEEEQEEDDDGKEKLFITEDPRKKGRKGRQPPPVEEAPPSEGAPQEEWKDALDGEPAYRDQVVSEGDRNSQQQLMASSKGDGALGSSMQEFYEHARDALGDQREYEKAIDLNSAYKMLRTLVKRPNAEAPKLGGEGSRLDALGNGGGANTTKNVMLSNSSRHK